jgi:ABC-type transport system substrate-binding protein
LLDQALAAGASTLDDAQRQAAYASAAARVRVDEGVIPLFPSLQVDARSNAAEGWGPTNVNDYVTWNVADWWLNE